MRSISKTTKKTEQTSIGLTPCNLLCFVLIFLLNYLLEIIKSCFDTLKAVLHALEFKRQPAVVARILENVDTLCNRHYTVTERRASKPVSALVAKKSVGAFPALLVKKVLCMYVEYVS